MTGSANSPTLFSSAIRAAKRDRAAMRGTLSEHFLLERLADELSYRLSLVTREFTRALVIGPIAHWANRIEGLPRDRHLVVQSEAEQRLLKAEADSVSVAQEDALDVEPQSYDLVIAGPTLDSVADLPQALLRCRFALKPDGLFLGAMFGAGTLASFRRLVSEAEGDRVAQHFHPQIDLADGGRLLQETGFALPVADVEMFEVRYSALERLVGDIRDLGIGNALNDQNVLSRAALSRLDELWRERADDDGKFTEQFRMIHLSGWAPSESQPKPARRGSGTVSLADALKPKDRSAE